MNWTPPTPSVRRSLAVLSPGVAAVLLAASAAAQDLNRMQLDNGGEVLWIINSPFEGAPVHNYDETGDLYWKVFPRDALQRCEGTSNLMGIEATVFDTDFASSEALWAYTITPGILGTSLTIQPVFTGAGIFVPGTSTTGTIFGSPGPCPGPGYVSGWIYTETFLDTLGDPTPLFPDLTSNGLIDWVFTHYFPAPGIADMDPVFGPPNSCGTTGDATFQWNGSIDGQPTPTSEDGENQPDVFGFGSSQYGGWNNGQNTSFTPIPEEVDGGAELAWFFQEPTMQVLADAGDGYGIEVGLVALETPLQISSGGVHAGGTTTVGVRFCDQTASSSSSVLLAAANVNSIFTSPSHKPFIDTIGCLPFGQALLGLNPLPGTGFYESFSALSPVQWGSGPCVDSVQIPVGTSGSWFDIELVWQAWQFDFIVGDIVTASNVFRNTMRANDGL